MLKAFALVSFAMLSACYGPVRDLSRIEATTELKPRAAAALVYHRYKVREPVGLAAFPDGGSPRVVRDSFIVALADGKGPVRRLMSFRSSALPGTGSVTLNWYPSDPQSLYVRHNGQRTTSHPVRTVDRLFRVDLGEGTAIRLDLDAELAKLQRAYGADGFGSFLPLDAKGTLLVGATRGARKELWRRTLDGSWQFLVAFDRFDMLTDEDLIWSRNGPPFATFATNWRSGKSRPILRYNAANTGQEWQARGDPAYQALTTPTETGMPSPEAIVAPDGQTLEYRLDGRTLWKARVRF